MDDTEPIPLPPPDTTLDDLAIPGCERWRVANPCGEGHPAALCPSVHCDRCQTLRQISGVPILEPYVGSIDG